MQSRAVDNQRACKSICGPLNDNDLDSYINDDARQEVRFAAGGLYGIYPRYGYSHFCDI